jgi:hypothetical protein
VPAASGKRTAIVAAPRTSADDSSPAINVKHLATGSKVDPQDGPGQADDRSSAPADHVHSHEERTSSGRHHRTRDHRQKAALSPGPSPLSGFPRYLRVAGHEAFTDEAAERRQEWSLLFLRGGGFNPGNCRGGIRPMRHVPSSR